MGKSVPQGETEEDGFALVLVHELQFHIILFGDLPFRNLEGRCQCNEPSTIMTPEVDCDLVGSSLKRG